MIGTFGGSRVLRTYLSKIGSEDPRMRSFIQAQNIDISGTSVRSNKAFDALMEMHKDRIEKYLYYWNLYMGNHWFNLSEENLDAIKINYCSVTVNKNVAFLMNKGFKVTSQFYAVEKYLQNMWELNSASKDFNLFGINMGIMGSVTGDVFIDALYDTSEIYQQEYLKIRILDSHECFPVVDGKEEIGLLHYAMRKRIKNENFGFPDSEVAYEGFYYDNKGNKTFIKGQDRIEGTAYSLREKPFFHIKNFPIPVSNYGMSDLSNIHDLNLTYDRISTDIQDIIDYHAQPVTILTGAKASELQRGVNKLWSLPNGASITNLRLEGDLNASISQLSRLRQNIAEVSGIPEGAVGKQIPMSNTSAAALAISFMPLYETMEYKRTIYGEGLLRINTYAIKTAILRGDISVNQIVKEALKKWREAYADATDEIRERNYPFSKPVDEQYNYDTLAAFMENKIPQEIFKTSVMWFPPLPRDDSLSAQLAVQNVASGIWSKSYARRYLGIDDIQIMQIEKELKVEQEDAIAMQQATLVTNEKIGMNPDSYGQKESMRVQNSTNQL